MNSYKPKTPKYEVVKEHLLSLIDNGTLNPGDKVPSEQELAELFSVSVTTSRKALLDLASEGIICRIKKKGTFVNSKENITPSETSKTVSFILPLCERSDNNLLQYVHGVQDYLATHGYSLTIEGTNEDIHLENSFIEQSIQKKIAGIIIFAVDPEKNIPYLLKLHRNQIPFVLIDRYPEHFLTNTVICDNFDGAFQSTEHLIQLGHKKILFVTHVASNQAELTRAKGYSYAMDAHGLPKDYPIFSYKEKEAILQKLQFEGFTAIVCANDYCALELSNMLNANGISIPEKVSLIGFDGQKATEYTTPPMTTIIQPCFEIGRNAAKILIEHIESPQKALEQAVLPVTLQLRKSTAPPKHNEL